MPVLAILVAQTGHGWGLYTLLSELPTYMKTVLHFDVKAVIDAFFLNIVSEICHFFVLTWSVNNDFKFYSRTAGCPPFRISLCGYFHWSAVGLQTTCVKTELLVQLQFGKSSILLVSSNIFYIKKFVGCGIWLNTYVLSV